MKTSMRLHRLKNQAVLSAAETTGWLERYATATAGRVDIEASLSLPEATVMLRPGNTLVVRSRNPLKPTGSDAALRQESVHEDGDYEVYTYTAIAAGSTHIIFAQPESGKLLTTLVVARIEVE